MWFQDVMTEALEKGEKIKNQLVKGVLHSKTFEEIISNERVLKSVSKAFTTKHQIEKTLRSNLKKALKFIDIPSREDIRSMQTKINQLENEMDGIHRKIMTKASRPLQAKAARVIKVAKKKISRTVKSKRR